MDFIKEKYLEILTTGASLTQLCDFTAECIETPVAITLATRTIIAKSRDYTPELVEEYTLSAQLYTPDEIKEHHEKINALLHSKKPIIGLYPYLRHKRINCGCFYNNHMLAVIDCPIVKKEISKDALSIVEFASSVFLTALKINSYISPNTEHPMQTYLAGVLRGEVYDHCQQSNLYESFLEAIQSWILIWVKPTTLELLPKVKEIIDIFCIQHERFWNIAHDDGVLIVLDAKCEKKIYNLYKLCSDFCSFSISEPFPHLKKSPKQLRLAQTALRLAEFEENDNNIVFVQQYKSLIIFLSGCQKNDFEPLENPIIIQIKKYDNEHCSDYFKTLRTYLLNNRDYSIMAKKLHVHKNTIIYRMQRISELFDINLKDCRVITELYLSLFIELL